MPRRRSGPRRPTAMSSLRLVLVVVAALEPALALGAAGLRLAGPHPRLELRPPEPPESSRLRDPADCNCDFCVSTSRLEPTMDSKTKCVPARTVEMGSECQVDRDVVRHAGHGVPYQLFCLCHCRPLAERLLEQCVNFSPAELEKADKDGDGNCEDPKLSDQATQQAELEAKRAAAKQRAAERAKADKKKAAKEAAVAEKARKKKEALEKAMRQIKNLKPPDSAPPELKRRLRAVRRARAERRAQLKDAEVAHETKDIIAESFDAVYHEK